MKSISFLKNIFSSSTAKAPPSEIKVVNSTKASSSSITSDGAISSVLKITEPSIQILIDVLYVILKAFLSQGIMFKRSESGDVKRVRDHISNGAVSITYLELLNDTDLLWSTFLVCTEELKIFTPDQISRLVGCGDADVLMLSSELPLAVRRLLGALFCGLVYVLDASHVAVSVSILKDLNNVLFYSLPDQESQLKAFFTLGANASSVFFYYEPFAIRLGMKPHVNSKMTWRLIESSIKDGLDSPGTSSRKASIAQTDVEPSTLEIVTSSSKTFSFKLKGATAESLRELFNKCLETSVSDSSGHLCANVSALSRACKWSVNAYPLADKLEDLQATVSFPNTISWTEFQTIFEPHIGESSAIEPPSPSLNSTGVLDNTSLVQDDPMSPVKSSAAAPEEDNGILVMDESEFVSLLKKSVSPPKPALKSWKPTSRKSSLKTSFDDDEFNLEDSMIEDPANDSSASRDTSVLRSSYTAHTFASSSSSMQEPLRKPAIKSAVSSTARSHESLMKSGLIVDLRDGGRKRKPFKPYGSRTYKSFDYDTEEVDVVVEAIEISPEEPKTIIEPAQERAVILSHDSVEVPAAVIINEAAHPCDSKEEDIEVEVIVEPPSQTQRRNTFSMTAVDDDDNNVDEVVEVETVSFASPEVIVSNEVPEQILLAEEEPLEGEDYEDEVIILPVVAAEQRPTQLPLVSRYANTIELPLSPIRVIKKPVLDECVGTEHQPRVTNSNQGARLPPPVVLSSVDSAIQCDLESLDNAVAPLPMQSVDESVQAILPKREARISPTPIEVAPSPPVPSIEERIHDQALAAAVRHSRSVRCQVGDKLRTISSFGRGFTEADSSVVRLNRRFLEDWAQEIYPETTKGTGARLSAVAQGVSSASSKGNTRSTSQAPSHPSDNDFILWDRLYYGSSGTRVI